MEKELIEFLKNEYVPKSTLRYMKIKINKRRNEINSKWSSISNPSKEEIDESNILVEKIKLIDEILSC